MFWVLWVVTGFSIITFALFWEISPLHLLLDLNIARLFFAMFSLPFQLAVTASNVCFAYVPCLPTFIILSNQFGQGLRADHGQQLAVSFPIPLPHSTSALANLGSFVAFPLKTSATSWGALLDVSPTTAITVPPICVSAEDALDCIALTAMLSFRAYVPPCLVDGDSD